MWGHVDGKLQPLLQIGERTAPALRAVVCEPLGALITAHNGAPAEPAAVRSWHRGGVVGFCAHSIFRVSGDVGCCLSKALPMLRLPPVPCADGHLRLRALPHVRSPAGLSVTFKKDTVFKISSAALAAAQIAISK